MYPRPNGYLIKQQQLLLMRNRNYCAVAGHCAGTSEQDGSAERSERFIPSRARDGGGDAASDRFQQVTVRLCARGAKSRVKTFGTASVRSN